MKNGIFLLCFLLLAGCSSEPFPETSSGDSKETVPANASHPDEANLAPAQTTFTTVPVIKVTDGDTIQVELNGEKESVRFLLVDSPETSHPRLGIQPYGKEAKEFVTKMLEGKQVQLEKDVGERDKYGRLLMYVYVDGVSVQESLLQEGLARVAYVYAPNTKYVDQYRTIQDDARQRKVGIWSIENYVQESGFQEPSSSPVSSPSSAPAASGCTIKGNDGSSGKIYHLPGGQFYKVTEAEEMFCSEEDALNAGYRKSQR